MEEDPFDGLLGLEDQFYNEGYQLGIADGKEAGKIEGRVFGLEKGYEKYIEMGKLHGRSLVWAARLPQKKTAEGSGNSAGSVVQEQALPNQDENATIGSLPALSKNPRLEKHIKVLYALVELDTLSTENTEDSVSDFDDRLKRAQGKIKIIEKLVGEEPLMEGASGQAGSGGGNIEDVDILKARH